MAARGSSFVWGLKRMKRLAFALTGAASLALMGCNRGNQDALNNAEMNQPSQDELNDQANQAAMDAANAAAALAAQQQQQLDQANAADNGTNPTDAEEQNVSGM
jgi:hypothetical protein